MPEMVQVPKKDFEEMERGFEEMKKEIEEWQATFKTLSNEKAMKGIEESRKAADEGREKSWKELDEELGD